MLNTGAPVKRCNWGTTKVKICEGSRRKELWGCHKALEGGLANTQQKTKSRMEFGISAFIFVSVSFVTLKFLARFLFSSECRHVGYLRRVCLNSCNWRFIISKFCWPALSPINFEDRKIRVIQVMFRISRVIQLPVFTMAIPRPTKVVYRTL